jgi:hypothetical protein
VLRSRKFTIVITCVLLLLTVEAHCCATVSRSIESMQRYSPSSAHIRSSLVRLRAQSSASSAARLHLRLWLLQARPCPRLPASWVSPRLRLRVSVSCLQSSLVVLSCPCSRGVPNARVVGSAAGACYHPWALLAAGSPCSAASRPVRVEGRGRACWGAHHPSVDLQPCSVGRVEEHRQGRAAYRAYRSAGRAACRLVGTEACWELWRVSEVLRASRAWTYDRLDP